MLVRQARQERETAERDQHRDDDQRRARRRRASSRRARDGGSGSSARVGVGSGPVAVSIGSGYPVALRSVVRRGSVRLRARSAPRIFPEDPTMISLQHVTKVYRNGTTALEDVSVEVEKGEFVFIVGASGSGKSTFIRLLLKEEAADQGRHLRRRQEPRQAHDLEDAAPAAQHRDGLPGLQAAAGQDGVRERRRSRSR